MPSDIAKRREVINFARKFDLFSEQWQPKVVAELNDYQFKIVRIDRRFRLARSPGNRRGFYRPRRRTAHRFQGSLRRAGAGRDVRRSQGHRAQAVCREGGQDAADRTARHIEYRSRRRRAHGRERRLDLIPYAACRPHHSVMTGRAGHRDQRSTSGSVRRATSINPARVAGCSGSTGWRVISERMTPPSCISTLAAESPHCRFS